MRKTSFKLFLFLVIIFCFTIFIYSCRKTEKVVHLYTALDYEYSKPIIDQFEKLSGIKVKVTYDTEATKTVGLVNRLIAEKDNPQCDVFWNNEIIRTLHLKNRGVLDKYVSKSSEGIPEKFRDSQGFWTGFAGRIRVIVYNTKIFKADKEYLPKSLMDLTKYEYQNRTAIANPYVGTSATHSSALYLLWGKEKTKLFFEDMQKNGVKRLPGNSVVRDYAAQGEIDWGMTDSDDVISGIQNGKEIDMIIPDQGEDEIGTLLIPNTVSLIKGAPHPEAAKTLIDYLLSKEVEAALAKCPSAQIPLHSGTEGPEKIPSIDKIKVMDINYEGLGDKTEELDAFLNEFSKDGM